MRLVERAGLMVRLEEHPGHGDQKAHGRRGGVLVLDSKGRMGIDLANGQIENISYKHTTSLNPCFTGTIDGERVFLKQPLGDDVRREMVNYLLNDLGGGLVVMVPSARRDDVDPMGGGGPVLVQEFIEGRRASETPWQAGLESEPYNDIAVFDFVTSNRDRHLGNAMIRPDGVLVAVDHGLSLKGGAQHRDYLYPREEHELTDRQRRFAEAISRAPIARLTTIGMTRDEAIEVQTRASHVLSLGVAPQSVDWGDYAANYGYGVSSSPRSSGSFSPTSRTSTPPVSTWRQKAAPPSFKPRFGTRAFRSKAKSDEAQAAMRKAARAASRGMLSPSARSIASVRTPLPPVAPGQQTFGMGQPERGFPNTWELRAFEAVLKEHPGHGDEKVHGRRGGGVAHLGQMIPVRRTGEEMLRGQPRQWPGSDSTTMSGLPEAHQAKIRTLTAAQFDGLTDDRMDANLEAVLERALKNPSAALGMTWYDQAHDVGMQVSKVGGIPEEHGVGMVAALSPQHEWGSNAAAAEYTSKTLKANPKIPDLSTPKTKIIMVEGRKTKTTKTLEEWARYEMSSKKIRDYGPLVGTQLRNHPPEVQAALIKALSQQGYGTPDGKGLQFRDDVAGSKAQGVQWSCGIDGITKAVRIWGGEPPHLVLNGHKVRSFFNNMLTGQANTRGDVTIDTHAASAAAGKKYVATSKPMEVFTGGVSLASHGSDGLYAQFADSYRRVAAKAGISVEQAQAVIWLQWRQENP